MKHHKAFVLGFVAGEGHFGFKIQQSATSDSGHTVCPCFEINVNSRERHSLERIAEELPVESSIYDKEKHSQLYVGGQSKGEELINYFDVDKEYWTESDKHDSFEKWAEAVKLICEGRHRTKDGFAEILAIRDEMNGEGHSNKLTKDAYLAQ